SRNHLPSPPQSVPNLCFTANSRTFSRPKVQLQRSQKNNCSSHSDSSSSHALRTGYVMRVTGKLSNSGVIDMAVSVRFVRIFRNMAQRFSRFVLELGTHGQIADRHYTDKPPV